MNAVGGLYVHIPFCKKKCRYCDFYSTENLSLLPAFLHAVKQEMAMRAASDLTFDTLYFGGGTPSLLAAEAISGLMDTLFSFFRFHENSEITIEVNPGTVDKNKLSTYARMGITRLNMGIQSFQDAHLKCLGRIHRGEEGIRAINLAREAGFRNMGLDLMIGLPDQTQKDLERDLHQLLSFHPEHVSCYMLSYEPGTPLYQMREARRVRPLSEKTVEAFYAFTAEFLKENGYEHYEISNFAKKETIPHGHAYRSRHNVKYWNGTPYIGLGPAAHTFLPSLRLRNTGGIDDYLKRIRTDTLPVVETENLTQAQRFMEEVFLSLRTMEGMVLATFRTRYNVDMFDNYGKLIADLEKEGYMNVTPDRLYLTQKGFLMADSIAWKFIQGMA